MARGCEPTSERWARCSMVNTEIISHPLRASARRVVRTDDWHQIRCCEVKSAYACPDESRRSRSLLNGYSVLLASTKAPPLAGNTEKSRGALISSDAAIVTANNRRHTPLSSAAV